MEEKNPNCLYWYKIQVKMVTTKKDPAMMNFEGRRELVLLNLGQLMKNKIHGMDEFCRTIIPQKIFVSYTIKDSFT